MQGWTSEPKRTAPRKHGALRGARTRLTLDSADKKCPFTGLVSIRGRILTGTVVSTKMHRTVIVRREYLHFIPKYSRYEKRHKNLAAHVSPAFRVEEGDQVTVGQCRPLSKTVRLPRAGGRGVLDHRMVLTVGRSDSTSCACCPELARRSRSSTSFESGILWHFWRDIQLRGWVIPMGGPGTGSWRAMIPRHGCSLELGIHECNSR